MNMEIFFEHIHLEFGVFYCIHELFLWAILFMC